MHQTVSWFHIFSWEPLPQSPLSFSLQYGLSALSGSPHSCIAVILELSCDSPVFTILSLHLSWPFLCFDGRHLWVASQKRVNGRQSFDLDSCPQKFVSSFALSIIWGCHCLCLPSQGLRGSGSLPPDKVMWLLLHNRKVGRIDVTVLGWGL